MTEILTQNQAAAVWGKTPRRLRQMDNEDDPPPKDANGKYPAREFGDWVRRQHMSGVVVGSDGEKLDFTAERARLAKEQADKTAMDNATRRGLLMERNEVAAEWSRIVMNFKTRMLAIPSKLAPLVFGMKSIPEIMGALKVAIYEALAELSANLAVEGGATSTGPKRKRVGGPAQKTKPGGKRRTG